MKSLMKMLGALALTMGMMAITAKAGTGSAAEAFETLKSLAGHWEATPAGDMKATLDIEVTSGGSAVIERFRMVDKDKSEEMVTMYYLDGDQVKLTHYCTAGNQPTMRGTYSPETKTLTFDFVSATNLKSPNDGHMHHAVYTFVDRDHLKQVWTFQKDRKEVLSEGVTYVRK